MNIKKQEEVLLFGKTARLKKFPLKNLRHFRRIEKMRPDGLEPPTVWFEGPLKPSKR